MVNNPIAHDLKKGLPRLTLRCNANEQRVTPMIMQKESKLS